jgi:signal transduction histidine kinase
VSAPPENALGVLGSAKTRLRLRPPEDWFPGGDRVFVAGYLSGVVLVWSAPGISAADVHNWPRIGATTLMVALACWWYWFGGRLARAGDDASWRGPAYLLGVLALFLPAVALVPACTWVLFALCPQPYMVRTPRAALRWVAAFNAVPPLLVLYHAGIARPFWTQVMIAVVAVAFSHFIGANIERIATQSRERALLIRELETSRAEVVALHREAGAAAERERLAAEIHDTLAQGFTSILTLIQAADSQIGADPDRTRAHLGLAAETARENLAEARALVGALAPPALDSSSLAEALRRQAARLSAQSGIAVEVETDGELGPLSTPAQVVLLRAAQEAMANVGKHSGARSAVVRLVRRGAAVHLTVSDDGDGFDPSAPPTGFGLRGMRARAEEIGGTLDIATGPGGTVLRLEVPA